MIQAVVSAIAIAPLTTNRVDQIVNRANREAHKTPNRTE